VRVQGKVEPIFAPTLDDLVAAILDVIDNGDVVLVMGAGSIARVAPEIFQKQKKLKIINE
jgi:UDP-N-acetylmuramate--alanine ligase